VLITVLLLLSFVSSAKCSYEKVDLLVIRTGSGFFKQCKFFNPGCSEYFTGVFDSMALTKAIFGTKLLNYKYKKAYLGEYFMEFVQFLKDNPEKLNEPTPVLIYEALFELNSE